MKKLILKNNSVFNLNSFHSNDLVLYFGAHNMAFGIEYRLAQKEFETLYTIAQPFETHAFQAIAYMDKKFLVCNPVENMSDQEIIASVSQWLNYASDMGLRSVQLFGSFYSKSNKESDRIQTGSDSNWEKLIVELVNDWFEKNPASSVDNVNFTMEAIC